SYYRRFVKNFSSIAKALNQLLCKGVKFEWSNEAQSAFEEFKKALTSKPLLIHFREDTPIILSTDASGYGIGAILSHLFRDKTERVVAYA
ncbi:uncharacterized protein B4U80_07647, partial [Leptotrombidium deliense]